MAIINGRGIVGIRSGTAAGPSTPSMVMSGLVLNLDAGNVTSYPGTGTALTDLSGNGIVGTLTGGVTYNSSNSGNLVFNGSTGYVDCGSSSVIQPTAARTISMWVWVSSTTAANYLYSTNNGSTDRNGVIIWQDSNGWRFELCNATTYQLGTFATNTTLYKDKWVNLVLTFDGSQIKCYMNNTLLNTYTQTITPTNGVNPTLIGKANQVGSYLLNGKISNVQVYNKALTASEITQNYDVYKSRFYPQVSDSDAQSFIYAAVITGSTEANAVNTLVTSLKSSGVWTKMKAIYPMVGGTATSHKFNLKDPRDLDAAFRLSFTAGWIHSSTGAKANGSSDYAETYFYPSVSSNINSSHISYYARTGSNSNTVWVASGYAGFLESFGGTMYGSLSTGFPNYMSVASSNYQFAMVNRTSSNYMELRKLGVMVRQSSAIATGYDASPYRLNSFGNAYYSPSECAFATIGDGLTDTEASNLYTAVQTYQTSLSRQV